MKVYIVTGAAGFIGSNFLHYLFKEKTDCFVINIDALTYAGNLANLQDIDTQERYVFIKAKIQDSLLLKKIRHVLKQYQLNHVHYLINIAAESHVDRSILNSHDVIHTNVLGTQCLLDIARQLSVDAYIQVSTDEVYGSLGHDGVFTEHSPIKPNSPYAASKASADLLVRSYFKTHALPTIITRCSNNYGPYQFPEKLIPLMIEHALADKDLPVYGNGENIRDWIHVLDHCRAIDAVIEHGCPGEIYNIGAQCEQKNIDVVQAILTRLEKPSSLIRYVQDRAGHDFRYAIDFSKIKAELGWSPSISFEDGLNQTIDWYLAHTDWLDAVKSGAYQRYYDLQYQARLPRS